MKLLKQQTIRATLFLIELHSLCTLHRCGKRRELNTESRVNQESPSAESRVTENREGRRKTGYKGANTVLFQSPKRSVRQDELKLCFCSERNSI